MGIWARRRAFFFSFTTVVLFTGVLLALLYAGVVSQSHDAYVQESRVAQKISYTWSDINDDVPALLNLTLHRNKTRVTLGDMLPAAYNVTRLLEGYAHLISSRNADASANATFSPSLSSGARAFTLHPFDITYRYPDLRKQRVDILCPPGEGCDGIREMDVGITLNQSFACDPLVAGSCNESQFNWTHAPASCSTSEGGHCIGFTLRLTDSLNRTYTCPNETASQTVCAYASFNWSASPVSTLEVMLADSPPCSFHLSLGGGNVAGMGTASADNSPCAFLTSGISLALNSSVYWWEYPVVLRVRNEASTQAISRALSG